MILYGTIEAPVPLTAYQVIILLSSVTVNNVEEDQESAQLWEGPRWTYYVRTGFQRETLTRISTSAMHSLQPASSQVVFAIL